MLSWLVALLVCSSALVSQGTSEVISGISVNNISQLNNTELEFDLFLHRSSTAWERWANGTFQLRLVGVRDDEYTDSTMSVKLVSGSSDLLQQSYKNTSALTAYVITPRVQPGRLSISIVGPDEFKDAKYVPRNDSIRLGRFHVSMLDSTHLRDTLAWVTPLDYYQANAFKIDADSMVANVKLYGANDNIEMRDQPCFGDSTNRVVRTDTFVIAARPPKCMKLDTFYTVYMGEKKVSIHWKTSCEQGVQGFILRRRIKEGLCLNPSELEFHEIRRFGTTFDPEMFAHGTGSQGFTYDLSVPDTVNYRDVIYQYELSALFFDGERRFLDTTDLYIPNAVIVRAAVFPNPVKEGDSAVIRYMIDDDVLLTAKVYDPLGKELQTLMDKKLHVRRSSTKKWTEVQDADSYTIGWSKPQEGAQGAYFVVFLAYPVDDNGVEMSRAVVKIMYVR